METPQTRDFYASELQVQLGLDLNVRRYPDAKRDLWSLVNGCLAHPGALGKLARIVRSFSGGTDGVVELEAVVAEIERQTLLIEGERVALARLMAEFPSDLVRSAATGLPGLFDAEETAYLDWSVPSQVVEQIEAGAEAASDPVLMLAFVDAVAHRSGGHLARDLHRWIDEVGGRLCFNQGEIRDLCLRSLQETRSEEGEGALAFPDDGLQPNREVGTLMLVGEAASGGGDEVRRVNDLVRAPVEPAVLALIWGNVPVRNPNFTGREPLLERLRDELTRHEKTSVLPQTLHGYGGVGKTQLAIEYVYRNRDRYDLVWWVPAERRTDALASLAELGRQLGLPIGEDLQQAARMVRVALGGSNPYRNRWLLVFDNAEQPEEIKEFVPSAGGHVILTSRNSDWAALWSAIEVDVFKRRESIQLLNKRELPIAEDAADALAEKLGDLPLALEQAANFQLATGMPVSEYLALFDKRVRELLDEGKSPDYGMTITAFLTLAFNRLRDASLAASELLDLFAYLGPEPFSAGMLRNGRAGDLSPALRRALRDPINMNRIIRDLLRYGLAKLDLNGQKIQVHRLVQAVLRDELDEDRRAQSLENVRNLLGAASPSRPDDSENWDAHAELGHHIAPADLIHADGYEARHVVLDQSRYLFVLGDYDGSRELGHAMVDAWSKPRSEGGLGPDHEQTLLACRHLANALRMAGEYAEARRLDEEAFKRLRDNPVFGNDHEHTVGVALGLGFDRSMANDLQGALQVDKENLERSMRVYRVYGPDHPDTARARSNVAASLRQLGRFREAYEISEKVVDEHRETLGAVHRTTFWWVCNLVLDLYGLGEYHRALETQTEHWEAAREVLKAHSREFLLGEHNVVICLRKTGALAEAVERARDNYQAFDLYFGTDHEYTLLAGMSYANALRAAGRLAEARRVGAATVDGYHKKFGADHRFSLVAHVNHGIILRLLGERRAALDLERDTYRALAAMLGEEHPHTLCAANNYASSLLLDHQVEEARELTAKTWEISKRVRGEEHPDTLACAVNVALDLQSAAGDTASQQRLDATLDVLERVLGREHPDVIDAIRGKRADCDIEPAPL